MLRLRSGSLAVACAVVACAACTNNRPTQTATLGRGSSGRAVELATFTGAFDPASGKLTLATAPSTAPGALTVVTPWSDGVPGSNPDNTVEIRTLTTAGEAGVDPAYGTSADGCGTGLSSYYGVIRIQSFFRNQALDNVYAEILTITSSDFNACNSLQSGVPAGVSNTRGLWSYGNIAALGHADQLWQFRDQSAAPFTFTGRILGDLQAPTVPTTGVEFDWTPTALVDPPRSFQDEGSTVSHLVWNGTSFTDSFHTSMTFTRSGGSGGSVATLIGGTVQPYATFGDGAYWVENLSTTTGQSAITTGGGVFTVCAKFKPGVPPVTPGVKTLFAKGNPIPGTGGSPLLGFALTERNGDYAFMYRTEDDNSGGIPHGDQVSYLTGGAYPATYTYDYLCGGRGPGTTDQYLWVQVHGAADQAMIQNQTGWFDAALRPLVIGAVEGAYDLAADNGLYEVILDSRAATPAVMKDIVGRAEGRLLPNSDGVSQVFVPSVATSTTILGQDGATYVLPPYATQPVSTDGSGLLDAGTVVQYTHPVTENTSTTGFCAGAVVQATGAWSATAGLVMSFASRDFGMRVNPFHMDGSIYNGNVTLPAWDPSTAHTFVICATAPSGGSTTITKYLDGSSMSASAQTDTPPDFSAATATLGIGGAAPNVYVDPANVATLTGARVRRVFICPTSNPASCQ